MCVQCNLKVEEDRIVEERKAKEETTLEKIKSKWRVRPMYRFVLPCLTSVGHFIRPILYHARLKCNIKMWSVVHFV